MIRLKGVFGFHGYTNDVKDPGEWRLLSTHRKAILSVTRLRKLCPQGLSMCLEESRALVTFRMIYIVT